MFSNIRNSMVSLFSWQNAYTIYINILALTTKWSTGQKEFHFDSNTSYIYFKV